MRHFVRTPRKIWPCFCEHLSGMNCGDVTSRPKGGFSFKVFGKDTEEEGRWTLVADYSGPRFDIEGEALRNAAIKIPWLAEACLSASSAHRKNIDKQKT